MGGGLGERRRRLLPPQRFGHVIIGARPHPQQMQFVHTVAEVHHRLSIRRAIANVIVLGRG